MGLEVRALGPAHPMNFKRDLKRIIRSQFDHHGIKYEESLDIGRLATSYLEMVNRRIHPSPRNVLFSDRIHHSLGELLQASGNDPEAKRNAQEAWETVFLLRTLLERGKNVNCFLGRGIEHASGSRSHDSLLWDFGLHHFHLCKTMRSNGFVNRSDHLLFAAVTNDAAHFVDVLPHRQPERLEWVQQDLLSIVYANWPELVAPHVLHGLLPSQVSDKELKEFRRKHVNQAAELGGAAIAPLGDGVMSDGSSVMCRLRAGQLLKEVQRHQEFFEEHVCEFARTVGQQGWSNERGVEFELAFLDSLDPPTEMLEVLRAENCFSKHLCALGAVVIEASTKTPVVISFREASE